MSNEDHGTTVTSDEPSAAECPVMNTAHQAVGITANQHWWPNQLNLRILTQHNPQADPMGEDFDYAAEFLSLDFDSLAADVDALMTQSQDWWPADYGHYGPFFIRMTWHAAGTYRIADGRGGGGSGAPRFTPLNSWPDNANSHNARRLVGPNNQKNGRKNYRADRLIINGNSAHDTKRLKKFR
jgi:catalase-peroxidase